MGGIYRTEHPLGGEDLEVDPSMEAVIAALSQARAQTEAPEGPQTTVDALGVAQFDYDSINALFAKAPRHKDFELPRSPYGMGTRMSSSLSRLEGGSPDPLGLEAEEDYRQAMAGWRESAPQGMRPVTEAQYGVKKYANGVIVIPGGTGLSDTAVVLMPSDPRKREKVRGSQEWVIRAQQDWDERKVALWRKKLAEMGYVSQPRGGWDAEMVEGLQMFFDFKYKNGGKSLPLKAQIDSKQAAKGAVKDIYTRDELRHSVRTMFRQTFDDDPSEDEEEHWMQLVQKEAMRLARKRNLTGTRLASATEAAVMNKWENDPDVEYEEENTELADSIAQAAQALSGLV